MRALHAFLTSVSPLIILAACSSARTDSLPPAIDSPSSQVDSPPAPPYEDGSRILSLRLRLRDGREVEVKTPHSDIDAVFTSADVLDKILIPYYEGKGETAMADSLRRSRAIIGNPHAYAAHRLNSRSLVVAFE